MFFEIFSQVFAVCLGLIAAGIVGFIVFIFLGVLADCYNDLLRKWTWRISLLEAEREDLLRELLRQPNSSVERKKQLEERYVK